MKIKTKIVSCHTADSKPVKQEDNSTVILPPLVFPGPANTNGNKVLQKKMKIPANTRLVFSTFGDDILRLVPFLHCSRITRNKKLENIASKR